MGTWRITVRYGNGYHRYHTLEVAAADIRIAMETAARELPGDVAERADLVEIRTAVSPDDRSYADE